MDSRVRFCKSATGDLQHFSADGQDKFVAEIQRAEWLHLVLQERSQQVAPFSAGGRICRGDLTAQTDRARFCKSATGGLRHFSAGERDDSPRRFNGVD